MIPIYSGSVPPDWDEDELRRVTLRKRGYSWAKEDETERPDADTVPVLRIPNIQQELDLADMLYLRNVSDAALRESAVEKGWILFVGSNGNPDRIGDSALMNIDRPMVFASFLMGLASKEPEKIIPEFLASWLRLHSVHQAFSKTSQQTTGLANFSWGAVKRLPVRFPKDQREQRAITHVLETADRAVAVTRAKITAVRRLKAALFQQLFSQGIPGRHRQFKRTKLGMIPASWEIFTVKSVLDGVPFSGVSPQSRQEPPGVPILNVECINDGVCTLDHVSYVDVDDQTKEECRARKGDFYVLRGNGNRDYVASGGRLAKEPEVPTIFSDKLIRLRFDSSKVVERFMPYVWQNQTFLHRIQSKAESGSGLWMISKRDIRRELFAYPAAKGEQEEMVQIVDAAIASLDTCVAELSNLDRLKRSLLRNLMTGQVRVKV
jgi:type I restriction enzyme, S subunit